MAKLEFTIGRLLAGKARDYLSRLKFEGCQIEFWESSGLFTRLFVVMGEEKVIRGIQRIMAEWADRLDRT